MGISFTELARESTFMGIINFNCQMRENKAVVDFILGHIRDGGGILYLCPREEERQGLERLIEILGEDFKALYDPKKIICIYSCDWLEDEEVDIDDILGRMEEGLTKLLNNGCESNLVYIDVGDLRKDVTRDESHYIQNRFKHWAKLVDTKFIFRYMMEDTGLNYYNTLILDHEVLLIEEGDKYKVYTPDKIFNEYLLTALKSCLKDEECREDIKRIESLKALGDIMEGAVHDVNNLLASIVGYVQLSLADGNSPNTMEHLQIINRTAMDGRNTIENIKSYIRGCSTSNRDYYSFDGIVNHCIIMAKYKFKSSRIKENKKLEIDISLNSHAFVYANEYEIRQSLLNIIFNGIDAMKDSGLLSINTYDEGEKVIVEISDTGEGISEENIGKIFDAYFTTKGISGTGLGLNIVRNVVDSHGGSIDIKSSPGVGTTFKLSFPIVQGMGGKVGNREL